MEKDGGGSIDTTLGPGRGKYKCSYQGPEEEVENDEYHREHQRSTRNEESRSRANSCADIEEGSTSSNGTSPRASSERHCAGRGGKEEHGVNLGRVPINDR
jgi:hypothetical protein